MGTITIDKLLYDAFSYLIRMDKDKKLDRDIMEQNIKLYQKGDKEPLVKFLDYLYRRNAIEIAEITGELDSEVMYENFIISKYK